MEMFSLFTGAYNMAKRRAQRRDPMDSIIESALDPGHYIGWNKGFPFVSELRHLEGEIAKMARANPARAITLYETFIAACNLKAEEVDVLRRRVRYVCRRTLLRLDSSTSGGRGRSRRDSPSPSLMDGP
jgi:hypothetical protein